MPLTQFLLATNTHLNTADNVFVASYLRTSAFVHVEVTSSASQYINLQTYNGGGGGWLLANPPEGFSFFFLNDKTSASDVFSRCSFIPRAHFETSLVMVRYYGYVAGGRQFLSENACFFNFFQQQK